MGAPGLHANLAWAFMSSITIGPKVRAILRGSEQFSFHRGRNPEAGMNASPLDRRPLIQNGTCVLSGITFGPFR